MVNTFNVKKTAILISMHSDPAHILVVDDDTRLRNLLKKFLNDNDIKNMDDLGAKMPHFQHAAVAMTGWMPLPKR